LSFTGVLPEQYGKHGYRYSDNTLKDISNEYDEPFGETRRSVMTMAYPGNTLRTRNTDGGFPIHADAAAQKYSRFVWEVASDTVKEAYCRLIPLINYRFIIIDINF
jgi:hypothetical protein